MEQFQTRYALARRRVIERDFMTLNPQQRQAALATEGPLLLLAGAGSGKTTVLIQRVYNLLTYGRGSDSEEVPDWATEEDLRFLENLPEQLDRRRGKTRWCTCDAKACRGRQEATRAGRKACPFLSGRGRGDKRLPRLPRSTRFLPCLRF